MTDEDQKERTLWCGNLSDTVTEELLFELFLQAGPLEQVKIAADREGRKKNFAFITFKHSVSVPYTIQLMKGISLNNRALLLQTRSGSSHSADNSRNMGPGGPMMPQPQPGLHRSFSAPAVQDVNNLNAAHLGLMPGGPGPRGFLMPSMGLHGISPLIQNGNPAFRMGQPGPGLVPFPGALFRPPVPPMMQMQGQGEMRSSTRADERNTQGEDRYRDRSPRGGRLEGSPSGGGDHHRDSDIRHRDSDNRDADYRRSSHHRDTSNSERDSRWDQRGQRYPRQDRDDRDDRGSGGYQRRHSQERHSRPHGRRDGDDRRWRD